MSELSQVWESILDHIQNKKTGFIIDDLVNLILFKTFYGSSRQDLKLMDLYLFSVNYEADIKQYLDEFENEFRKQTTSTLSKYFIVKKDDFLDNLKFIFQMPFVCSLLRIGRESHYQK